MFHKKLGIILWNYLTDKILDIGHKKIKIYYERVTFKCGSVSMTPDWLRGVLEIGLRETT
ncbi:hypothetical protein NQ318_021265 [Aromia moschata]|uniref:Uncharacterized protein n=1 Tax=Aromia moschata TaxID=1265417 RepID=A0AAV8ZBB8_9CUCU|nr:hypothetical protein NQ318_021265 [Aromia moschata]